MPPPKYWDTPIEDLPQKDRDEALAKLGMNLDQAKALHRYLVEMILERNDLREEVKRLRESGCVIVRTDA